MKKITSTTRTFEGISYCFRLIFERLLCSTNDFWSRNRYKIFTLWEWRMCLDHLSSDALQSRSLLLTRNLNLSLSILKRRRATPREDRTSVLEMEVILPYFLNSALLTNVLWAFVKLIPFLSRSLRQAGRWWFQEFLRPRWSGCVHYKHTLLLLFLDPQWVRILNG